MATRVANTVLVRSLDDWSTLMELSTSERGQWDNLKKLGVVQFYTKQQAAEARRLI